MEIEKFVVKAVTEVMEARRKAAEEEARRQAEADREEQEQDAFRKRAALFFTPDVIHPFYCDDGNFRIPWGDYDKPIEIDALLYKMPRNPNLDTIKDPDMVYMEDNGSYLLQGFRVQVVRADPYVSAYRLNEDGSGGQSFYAPSWRFEDAVSIVDAVGKGALALEEYALMKAAYQEALASEEAMQKEPEESADAAQEDLVDTMLNRLDGLMEAWVDYQAMNLTIYDLLGYISGLHIQWERTFDE